MKHELDVPGFRVVQGDLLADPARILVCPVNCKPGVMGKGLAKAFAGLFPGLIDRHRMACEDGTLDVGRPRMVKATFHSEWDAAKWGGPKVRDIILFPTKLDWRNDARYDWIFAGLAALYPILGRAYEESEEVNIAVPALGCGLGRLEWPVIANMIRCWSAGLPERYSVILYAPKEVR